MHVFPDNGLTTEILTYAASIDSLTQPLIQLSILYKISWWDLSSVRMNHCFGCRIKTNKSKFYVSIFFVFFNKIFTDIWYLKPLISSNKSLNKSLILDLLASNWAK